MKTECRQTELLISFYQDGELEEAEMKRLSEHIKACLQCRRRFESLEWTAKITRSALSSPPAVDYDDIWDGIQLHIRRGEMDNARAGAGQHLLLFLRRMKSSFFRPVILAPAFAVCAAAVVILLCLPHFFRPAEIPLASSVESVSSRTGSVMIMQTATTSQPIIWILEKPSKERPS